MTGSSQRRREAAFRAGREEGLAAAEAERNLFKGKYRSIVTLLNTTRQQIQEIFDHLDDEGDRVYLGSTNHRDWLRDKLNHMDRWSFDAMLPKGDINKMEADPYAEIRAQRARAEAAEAEVRRRAPSPQPNIDPALVGIAEEMKESGGHWQPCTGCYDTEDGHPTQKYDFSQSLQTSIGCGCHECGGLGAVWWHMTDEEVEDFARACEEVDIEHRLTVRIARLEFALRGLSKAYADCNGEDHPAYEEAQRLLAGSPSPETNMKGDGEAAIIECLAAGQSFVFDPATNFLHADNGTVQGIRYIAEHGDLPQSPWPASDWAIGRIKELEAQAVPEGWQLVPKEPTNEMHNAARDWAEKKYGLGIGRDGSDGCYRAMLAAAPAKQEGGADGC